MGWGRLRTELYMLWVQHHVWREAPCLDFAGLLHSTQLLLASTCRCTRWRETWWCARWVVTFKARCRKQQLYNSCTAINCLHLLIMTERVCTAWPCTQHFVTLRSAHHRAAAYPQDAAGTLGRAHAEALERLAAVLAAFRAALRLLDWRFLMMVSMQLS